MKLLRIYADTSVIGGCLDPEFWGPSRRFIEAVKAGHCRLLVSELVLAELDRAPQGVQDVLRGVPPLHVETVPLSREILDLRDAYPSADILVERWANDATHVAAASIARADAIVSWNFKHIVRLDKMKAYNQVNLLNGYGMLTIITPREALVEDGDAEEAV